MNHFDDNYTPAHESLYIKLLFTADLMELILSMIIDVYFYCLY
jgi:hypothetical protein